MKIYRISYKIQNFDPNFRILDAKAGANKRCTPNEKSLCLQQLTAENLWHEIWGYANFADYTKWCTLVNR
jgi:hypothetical protein